jgi:hypothetical protein
MKIMDSTLPTLPIVPIHPIISNEITFSSDQEVHFNYILNNIAPYYCNILDSSVTGSGKTEIACRFAKIKNFKRIIVFCNGSVQIKHWEGFKNKYKLPFILIISYDFLRGSKTIPICEGKEKFVHGLLYKCENYFEPTEEFKFIVEEGLLIICDEFHLIKNCSARTAAVRALTSYITFRSDCKPYLINKSYNLFMSMTPFEKLSHCVNFVITCGIIKNSVLFCKKTEKALGILDLYEYCLKIDPEKTNLIWGLYDLNYKNVNNIAYRLIVEIFLRKISSFSKNSQDYYLKKQSIYYSHSDISPDAHEMMKLSLNMIKSNSVKMKKKEIKEDIDEISNKFNNISLGGNINDRTGIIQGMITVQTIKTNYIMIPLIVEIFRQVPRVKIVVFLSYKEAINIIMDKLNHLNPRKITGDPDCTYEIRNKIISKFNEPNLESRLLVIISQIGSDGIELDDKLRDSLNPGLDFPRIGLGIPDFYHSRFFQCPGRIFRRMTFSNSLFFWCLINTEEYSEESVFKSIIEKSEVMEETLQNNEIIPPVSYEKIINPHLTDIKFLLDNAGKNKTITNIKIKKEEKPIIIKKISMYKDF